MWEHFHHEADIGIRGRGATLESAFEQGAMGLTAVITNPDSVKPGQQIRIRCSAPDLELLFADWLNALIFEMSSRRMLFSRFRVEIRGNELIAVAWGEPIDRARHQPVVEVKGATYTALSVGPVAGGRSWQAQAVVDV